MKVPTMEEQLELQLKFNNVKLTLLQKEAVIAAMKDNALAHVNAALEAVYEAGLTDITKWDGNPYTGEGSDYLDKDKILKCYPTTNIK